MILKREGGTDERDFVIAQNTVPPSRLPKPLG